ncbi:Flp pilus assembly protein CpaB [Proteiniclasticum sp. C24MP]|uniref:Flp pilus assembly protein CpaB n=1 Tax=Proteiniclasticum sp. C24MP TaxID=3374101 RepID=UPI0037547791
MKVKKRVVILAVLLGLITMSLLYVYIEGKSEVEEVKVDLSNVVVAVTSIPAHVTVTPEMVTTKSIPTEAVHPEAVRNVDDIIGYTTSMAIYNDEQVLKNKVITETESASLSYRIPENMRAITIPMNEISGVGGYIVKGDKVDILVTYEIEVEPTNPEAEEEADSLTITYTQFQNIEILEKGPNVSVTTEGAAPSEVATSLTFLVSPSQAEVLTFAQYTGSINMTLRNPVDENVVELTEFGDTNFNTWRGR